MAQVLTAATDEIIFVDYNTPNDFPTFPEAIQDTLTARAKRLLRTLRVRPAVHARYAGRTHLQALEPIARNVAVRRSNPANRWILSTNTDMIFYPLAHVPDGGRVQGFGWVLPSAAIRNSGVAVGDTGSAGSGGRDTNCQALGTCVSFERNRLYGRSREVRWARRLSDDVTE